MCTPCSMSTTTGTCFSDCIRSSVRGSTRSTPTPWKSPPRRRSVGRTERSPPPLPSGSRHLVRSIYLSFWCFADALQKTTKFKYFLNNERHPSWKNDFVPGMKFEGIYFGATGMEFKGIYMFILAFVCNCNLFHRFWTERYGDFIFGMHIQLPEPFQMTPKLMTLWPWLTFIQ